MQKPNVLVYGDSRSWGKVPNPDNIVQRYQESVRWPGSVKLKLHHKINLLEECLPGRTLANLRQDDESYKNGLECFKSIYSSHWPLQLIILDLATNDLQDRFDRKAIDIYEDILAYYEYIENFTWTQISKPRILYLLPSRIDTFLLPQIYNQANQKLIDLHLILLHQSRIEFVNCEDITSWMDSHVGSDGVHTNDKQHETYSAFITTWLYNNFVN
jgi:lysophospholipase L1-like esterase